MLSYQPDLDPSTPNVITVADNLVPTLRGGMRQGYTTSASGIASAALAALAIGCHLAQRTDGVCRFFVGAADSPGKLYELTSPYVSLPSTWTDVSRAGGYAANLWLFEQYNDTVIACAAANGAAAPHAPQVSEVALTAFADLSGAPKGQIPVIADNALLLFNVVRNGVTYTDGWHRSDTGNLTNWTPEVDGGVGESAYGRFTEAPGPITAAIKRGGEIVVFKASGMWRGRYVGLPAIMEWEFMGSRVGCLGPKGVVAVDDVLYFISASDIWRYDGSRPVSITVNQEYGISGIKLKYIELYRSAAGIAEFYTTTAHDDEQGLLYFFYGYEGLAGKFRHLHYLAYNYRTGAWGVGCEQSTVSGTNGGGIDLGSFLNAPSDMVRKIFSSVLSPTKSCLICFGRQSGTEGWPRLFRDGFSTGTGSTISWEMPWITPTAKQGNQIVCIYPVFKADAILPATDTLTVTVTAFRDRGGGYTQAAPVGTFNSSSGKVDVNASGTMFKTVYTGTPAAVTSAGFEFVNHEIEFGGARPTA
jgi:hypothetical protein